MDEVARMYLDRLTKGQQAWEQRWNRDLVGAFGALQERGVIEIITCAATHGFLPLMETFPEAMRAQIFLARDHYREMFGRDPRGIWLPECAYTASLDRVLREAELRWFILDSHGLMFGTPRPRYARAACCASDRTISSTCFRTKPRSRSRCCARSHGACARRSRHARQLRESLAKHAKWPMNERVSCAHLRQGE